MKELTTEQKARAYDKAIEKIKYVMEHGVQPVLNKEDLQSIFPEIFESEDEKIRKALIDGFTVMKESKNCGKTFSNHNIPVTDILAWLEKQGKETSWKPSKEEMDVLYSLAYITNQYDERKEIVITRLYQDLKREFFNASSYENMFPTNISTEDDVRRRSIIQVLEYARSLDTYNQFGKADIDKNIAWLEKQGEQKDSFDDFKAKDWYVSKVDGKIHNMYHSVDKVEPKFKVGDFIIKEKSPAESLGISPEKYNEIVNECIYGEEKPANKIEPNFSNSPEIGKNDALLNLLHKMPSCITVDEIDYHFVLKKTITYMAFYEGEGEGSGKVIFWMAGDPIAMLTAMLEKLKDRGLLE